MKIPVEKLYGLEGEDGPGMQRLREEMAILFSPRLKAHTEKLLRDAYALHGTPVIIELFDDDSFEYLPYTNTVYVNLHEYEETLHIAKDGTHFQPALSTLIEHELRHATQQTPEDIVRKNKLVADEATELAKRSPIAKALNKEKTALRNTPYTLHAHRHIERVIKHKVAFRALEAKLVDEHPHTIAYEEAYEAPAVADEALVAQELGMPVREYYGATTLIPEALLKQKHEYAKELQDQYKVDKKAGIAPLSSEPAKKSWKTFRQEGSKFKLEIPDHPLLAIHKDGGIA